MRSVTSTILLLFCNWLYITARFILGYVVRRLVIIQPSTKKEKLRLEFRHEWL